MKTILTKLQNFSLQLLADLKQWAINDWNKTVVHYYAACDRLCATLKKALRMV